MKRCVGVCAVLKVNVDLEVENFRKDRGGLGKGGVVESITANTIGMVSIKGAGGDDLVK